MLGIINSLSNAAGLETIDSLDTTTTGETTESGFGDTLDVIPTDSTVTSCASFSKTLCCFAATRHLEYSPTFSE